MARRYRGQSKRKLPTAKKAGTILREGRARGKKLTGAQKRFFGWVRGGAKPRSRRRRKP